MRYIFLYLFIFFCSSFKMAFSQQQAKVSDELVIAEMNYCITSLTNIINDHSIDVLDYELDQLINNLTISEIRDLPEIAVFRSSLMEGISNLTITEEERQLYCRVKELRHRQMLWQSISTAVNNVIIFGSSKPSIPEAAAYALLTAARAGVEYKVNQYNEEIDQLQVMWEFRKAEITQIKALRKEALDLEERLYSKFRSLKESDRLVEKTANSLFEILNEKDSMLRLRKLKDNEKTYSSLADFYYHLGMAYIDNNDYASAKPYLNKYLQKYAQAPIFRTDPKTGIIALTKLTYEDKIPVYEKKALIQKVLDNLPNNGSAWLQCSIIYINELNNEEEALNLLRKAIDNRQMTEKDILVMTLASWAKVLQKYPSIHKDVTHAVTNCETLSCNSLLAFTVSNHNAEMWDDISKNLALKDVVSNKYILWGQTFDNDYTLKSTRQFSLDDIDITIEKHKEGGVKIVCDKAEYAYAIKKEKINKVEALKKNPNLTYHVLVPLYRDMFYRVRSGLDYNKIMDGTDKVIQIYHLSDSEREDLVDFLKENEQKDSGKQLRLSLDKDRKPEKNKVDRKPEGNYIVLHFKGLAPVVLTYYIDEDSGEAIQYSSTFNNQTYFKNPQQIKAFRKQLRQAAVTSAKNVEEKEKKDEKVMIEKTKDEVRSLKNKFISSWNKIFD